MKLTVAEKIPFFMLLVEGIVIVEESKSPGRTPMIMNPFMLVIEAVITTEVNPEIGEDMVMIGVV